MNPEHTTSMRSYSLSQAELAVLTRQLLGDDLSLDTAAQLDLGVDAAALGTAEESLRERGWLAQGDSAVADELLAVLATTIVPDQVAIVRTSLPDSELPTTNFSWTAERIVSNHVDAQGRHVFAVLDGLDAVDRIIATSQVPDNIAGAPNGATAALETLVAGMQALTILMVVEQPARPDPVVRNLSWLLANNALWLVDGEQAGRQQARSVDRAALRLAVGTAIGSP